MPDNLKTVRDLIRWGHSCFNQAELHFGHGVDNPMDEAHYLVAHAINQAPVVAEAYWDCAVTEEEKKRALELIQRRVQERVPAAYLTGEAWFCGLPFEVNSDVLIPRSPIAELIYSGFEPWVSGFEAPKVLELCTGSGCIALAIAAQLDWSVDAIEISPQALEVAQRNRQALGLEHQVNLIESDLWANCPDRLYDLIIANPPYVGSAELDSLPSEYGHEPRLALHSEMNGLEIPLRILASAADYLRNDGILVLEVGNSEPELQSILPEFEYTSLEFEHGGHGVILADRNQLAAVADRCKVLVQRSVV